MKTLIAVPTRHRLDSIGKDTLSWLPQTGEDFRVFVEPQEAALFRKFYPQHADKMVVLESDDRGWVFVRKAIRDYAASHGYDLVFKCDDDVRGWQDESRTFITERSVAIFAAALNKARALMTAEPKVKAVGFPYSFQMFDVSKEWQANARTQSCYLIRTESIAHDDWVEVFEDFFQFISIQAAGGCTARYCLAGMVLRPVGKYRGGLQDFDRGRMADRTLNRLGVMFPYLKRKTVTGKAWTEEPDIRSVPKNDLVL